MQPIIALLLFALPFTVTTTDEPLTAADPTIIAPKPPRPPHLPWVNRLFYRGVDKAVRLAERIAKKKLDHARPFPGPAVYSVGESSYQGRKQGHKEVYEAPQKYYTFRRSD